MTLPRSLWPGLFHCGPPTRARDIPRLSKAAGSGVSARYSLAPRRLLPQSSSARRTAGAAGFLILSQWSDRPER